MASDYLSNWNEDWLARGGCDPELAPRAWELREKGWSYAEIAGRAGVSVAQAYQLVASHREYEQTPDPIATMAHLLTTVNFELAHVTRHLKAALDSSGAERQFNIEHAASHTASAIEHAHHLTDTMKRTYPAIGKEYDKVAKGLEPT